MTAPQDPYATPDPSQQPPSGQVPPPPAYGQQPGYGEPPYGPPFATASAASGGTGLAIGSLVLGLLSLVSWFLFIGGLLGIAAVVLGVLARGRAKRGQAGGRGMALAGIVTGTIGVLLTALVVVGVFALFNSGGFSDLTDCLQDAGGDRQAMEECSRQFEERTG